MAKAKKQKTNKTKEYGLKALAFAKEGARVAAFGILQGASFSLGLRWISSKGSKTNLTVLGKNGQKDPSKVRVVASA